MPRKISSISSEVWVRTWRLPKATLRPGRVTSRLSDSSLARITAASTISACSSKALVRTSRTSLTCLPTTGRSSLDRSLRPFSSSVKEPFFPRTATRKSCNSFWWSPFISFNFAWVETFKSSNCFCKSINMIHGAWQKSERI